MLSLFIGSLTAELERDGSATFYYLQGPLESPPGPNIKTYYDPPYFTFYNWPRCFSPADDKSMEDAYHFLSKTIADEGPFDGLLGFSHGSTLAAGYLAHLAKDRQDVWDLPVRCAVLFNSLPPFQVKDFVRGTSRTRDIKHLFYDEGLEGWLKIPTLHIVGQADFIYEHSMKLYELCDAKTRTLVSHKGGHELPAEEDLVKEVAKGIRELGERIQSV